MVLKQRKLRINIWAFLFSVVVCRKAPGLQELPSSGPRNGGSHRRFAPPCWSFCQALSHARVLRPLAHPLWTHGSITARWQRAGRAEVWMEWNVAGACELKWLQFTFSIIYGKQFLYCFAVTSRSSIPFWVKETIRCDRFSRAEQNIFYCVCVKIFFFISFCNKSVRERNN